MSELATDTLQPARPVTPIGILAATLDRLAERLASSTVVDAAVRDELQTARELAGGLEAYVDRWTTPESPQLQRIAEQTAVTDWSRSDGAVALEQEMLSGHVEGQFLKMLVRITRARRVLEIGMFTGYSALAMAEALPSDGTVVACELDAGVAEFAGECLSSSEHRSKIDIRVGPALQTLADLTAAGDCFDLIFIDADKSGYVDYLAAVLDSTLLAPGGLLCADNTLLQGEPWSSREPSTNGAAIAAFNRAVADDPRVEQVIVPLRDGLTLVHRTADDR